MRFHGQPKAYSFLEFPLNSFLRVFQLVVQLFLIESIKRIHSPVLLLVSAFCWKICIVPAIQHFLKPKYSAIFPRSYCLQHFTATVKKIEETINSGEPWKSNYKKMVKYKQLIQCCRKLLSCIALAALKLIKRWIISFNVNYW